MKNALIAFACSLLVCLPFLAHAEAYIPRSASAGAQSWYVGAGLGYANHGLEGIKLADGIGYEAYLGYEFANGRVAAQLTYAGNPSTDIDGLDASFTQNAILPEIQVRLPVNDSFRVFASGGAGWGFGKVEGVKGDDFVWSAGLGADWAFQPKGGWLARLQYRFFGSSDEGIDRGTHYVSVGIIRRF